MATNISRETAETQATVLQSVKSSPNGDVSSLDIVPNDPLLTYILNPPGVIEVDKLNLESPTLQDLREAGVKISFPLVSQGKLIELINLGSRLSEQEYSRDDFRLLQDGLSSLVCGPARPALKD